MDAAEGGHFHATSEEAHGGRDHPEAPRSGVGDRQGPAEAAKKIGGTEQTYYRHRTT